MQLFYKKLPAKGLQKQEILTKLQAQKSDGADWKKGRTFSLVFYPGEEGLEVAKAAYETFFSENALNPSVFPGLRRMEMEVVSMIANLLGGNRSVTGTMTSGGTESILMAVKSCREWFLGQNPQISRPSMVVADSAHPAFEKAAHYFGIEYRVIPVNSSYEADPDAMEGAIDSSTMMMVCSAVSYPFGILDPVSKIARIARKYNLWLHVDACIGGMVLAFANRKLPEWNFKVRGVSSMSIDLHKYGYSAKGASVVLYKNKELRRHQFYVTTDWPGGIYASPGLAGTRPGGTIAAAWSVLQYHGKKGYSALTRSILETTEKIIRTIDQMEDLKIIGNPAISLLAIGSDTIDIFHVADYLNQKGWYFDRCQRPAAIHLTIGPPHAEVIEEFLNDLQDSVNLAKNDRKGHEKNQKQIRRIQNLTEKLPGRLSAAILKIGARFTGSSTPKKSAAMYGMMGSLPDRKNVKDMVLEILDKLFERR